MSEAQPGAAHAPLLRVFRQWSERLLEAAAPGVSPLLRLDRGAGMVQGAQAEPIAGLLASLLTVAAPLLYVAPSGAPTARGVRPKVRASLSLLGSSVLADVRYFGAAPADLSLRAAVAALGPQALALPPQLRARASHTQVCLRAVWTLPARRWPLVHLLAGRREVAVPMFSVARALALDAPEQVVEDIRSLAGILGEEPVPATRGRPAVLLIRRRGAPVALRVESLLGHGSERVLPAGPLLHAAPWLLGVFAREDQPPVLVIDPLALLSVRDHPTAS